jgi:hypothetical protein
VSSLVKKIDALDLGHLKVMLFTASLLVYASATLWICHKVGPTGDEPHYLMLAHSLLVDHDVDLYNNYQQKDYRYFFDAELQPHSFEYGKEGTLHSVHNVGLPLMILPAYWIGGRLGAALFVSLTGALLAVNIFSMSYEFAGSRTWAVITSCVAFATVPLVPYASQIYTAIPSALLITVGFRWAWNFKEDHDLTPLLLGLVAAFLPWLHVKYLVASVALLLLAFVRFYGLGLKKRWVLLSVVPFMVSLALLSLFFWRWYGRPLPNAQYSAVPGTISFQGIHMALIGWFLDQEYGILLYSPVYLTALVGAIVALWRRKTQLLWISVVFGSLYLVELLHWPPGFCAPGRLVVPEMPVLAAFMAYSLGAVRWRAFRFAFSGLALVSLANAGLMLSTPVMLPNWSDGTSNLLTRLSPPGHDLTAYFPSLVPLGQMGHIATFEAESMWRNTGGDVQDLTASNGRAKFADPAADGPGAVVYGPYLTLQKGRYVARFSLKTSDNISGSPIAALDVCGQTGNLTYVVLVAKQVTGPDFERAHVYKEFSLEFDNPGKLALEFRVFFQGAASLWVDRIDLIRLGR